MDFGGSHLVWGSFGGGFTSSFFILVTAAEPFGLNPSASQYSAL
jgi:hypothetical protein